MSLWVHTPVLRHWLHSDRVFASPQRTGCQHTPPPVHTWVRGEAWTSLYSAGPLFETPGSEPTVFKPFPLPRVGLRRWVSYGGGDQVPADRVD